MSTTAFATDLTRPGRPQGPRAFASDTLVLTRRNLLLALRTPQLVVAAAVMPVMFVLLFRYVFGGALHVAGYANYVDYLIPGIIVQTSLFGGSSSAVSVAEDLSKGATDRFRSLPTHRGAILTARTLADLVRLTYTVGLMTSIGLLVGFRFHNALLPIVGGIGIALFFGYACAWLFTLLGLVVRNVETATLTAFLVTFPLVFAASTFTSTDSFLVANLRQRPARHPGHRCTPGVDAGNRPRNGARAPGPRLVGRHPHRRRHILHSPIP